MHAYRRGRSIHSGMPMQGAGYTPMTTNLQQALLAASGALDNLRVPLSAHHPVHSAYAAAPAFGIPPLQQVPFAVPDLYAGMAGGIAAGAYGAAGQVRQSGTAMPSVAHYAIPPVPQHQRETNLPSPTHSYPLHAGAALAAAGPLTQHLRQPLMHQPYYGGYPIQVPPTVPQMAVPGMAGHAPLLHPSAR